jgi:hypothetical protein
MRCYGQARGSSSSAGDGRSAVVVDGLVGEEIAPEEVLMLGVAAGSLSSQRVLWLEDVKGVLLLGIDGDAETLQWPVIATWHRVEESRVDAKGGA